MREQGWEGARYGSKHKTTLADDTHRRYPDLVDRRFYDRRHPPGHPRVATGRNRATSTGREGDNLAIHRAVDDGQPGDVLAINANGDTSRAVFGDILGDICVAKGIAGFVIDGATRDVDELTAMKLPVFAAAVTPGRPLEGRPRHHRLRRVLRTRGLPPMPNMLSDWIIGRGLETNFGADVVFFGVLGFGGGGDRLELVAGNDDDAVAVAEDGVAGGPRTS